MARKIGKRFCYLTWRKLILNRDMNRCQLCGNDQHLNIHHVTPVRFAPEMILDVNNGVTVCVKCHKSIHAEIGYSSKRGINEAR